MSKCSGFGKMTMIKMHGSLPAGLMSVCLMLFLSCHALGRLSGKEPESKYYQVIRVIDGDTFRVDDGSEKGMAVRLIGIDAPETRRTRRKEVGFFAEESGEYLSSLILGKSVRLEFDVDTFDHYHRVLAYVFLRDGTFLNARLLREGYAVVLTVPPNVRYAEQFVKLARRAREKGRGLWAAQPDNRNEKDRSGPKPSGLIPGQ